MHNVYGLFDVQEGRQHVFAAPGEQSAKDAVAAFLVANFDKFFTPTQKEQADKLQSVISETTSLDELKSALVGWDFVLEMVQVV